MNRRTYKRALASVALAIGLLVGVLGIGTAAAWPPDSALQKATPGIPFAGQCKFYVGWDTAGTPNPNDGWIRAASANYPTESGACGSTFQFKWLCGIYGNTATYYWAYSPVGAWSYPGGGSPASQYFYMTDPCPVYSNDIIINAGIVVWAWTNYYICWNMNANNWVYLRSDMPCTFQ